MGLLSVNDRTGQTLQCFFCFLKRSDQCLSVSSIFHIFAFFHVSVCFGQRHFGKIFLIRFIEIDGNFFNCRQDHQHVRMQVQSQFGGSSVLIDDSRNTFIPVIRFHDRNSAAADRNDNTAFRNQIFHSFQFNDRYRFGRRNNSSVASSGILDESIAGLFN